MVRRLAIIILCSLILEISTFTTPPFNRPHALRTHKHTPGHTKLASSSSVLPGKLETYVAGFARLSDEKLRYKQLLFLAQKCPPMDDAFKTNDNKVPGCLSTVHVHASYNALSNTVDFLGDSDGLLTKGLVAMLVDGLSGCTPEEVQTVDPSFIQRSGIEQSLTPGRNNGFLNMIQVMKEKAKQASEEAGNKNDGENYDSDAKSSTSSSSNGPIYDEMISRLSLLKPTSITLIDNSHLHANHPGSSGYNGESHFSLSIVASAFEGLSSLKRHRLIYTVLGDVMDRIHAIEIEAKDNTQI